MSQLRKNIGSGVLTNAVQVALILLSHAVFVRTLGNERYGLWIILTTVLAFAQLGNFGIGPAVTKLVAEYLGRGDVAGAQAFVPSGLILMGLSGLSVVGGSIVFASQLAVLFGLTGQAKDLFVELLPYVGVISLHLFVNQVLMGAVSGAGRMDIVNYANVAGRAGSVILAVVLLSFGLGLWALLLGSVLSNVILTSLSIWGLRRVGFAGCLSLQHSTRGATRRLWEMGATIFGGSIFDMLMNPFNKVIVSRYGGPSWVLVYEIGFTGSQQVRGLVESGVRALMPEVSRLEASAKASSYTMVELVRKATLRVLWLALPLYTGLFLVSGVLLEVGLGDAFLPEHVTVFRGLLGGSLLGVLGASAYHALIGVGRVRTCLAGHVIQLTVNVGAVGAAIALQQVSLITVVTSVNLAFLASNSFWFWSASRPRASVSEESFVAT